MERSPRIIPEYRKKYLTPITKETEGVIIETKDEVIKSILNLPPYLARGKKNHYIEINNETDPPTLIWKIEILKEIDEMILRMDRNRFERQLELDSTNW